MTTCLRTVGNRREHSGSTLIACRGFPILEALLDASDSKQDEVRRLIRLLEEGLSENEQDRVTTISAPSSQP